ncbi:MAG: hydroxypyruvate isomerase [Planctomycetaceae bacterium]|nr:hydroxypyruvate isomerase [Planctomycetaceae bacterium]
MTNRRTLLKSLGLATTTAIIRDNQQDAFAAPNETAVKGRAKQSIVFWCFNARGDKWSAEKTCEVTKELGVSSVELISPMHWPTLKKHGLICAIASNGSPGGFKRAFNNVKFHAETIEHTTKTIDLCADAGVPSVIAFVGYRWTNPDDPKSAAISTEDAFTNCVKGLKELAVHAEKKGVTVCVEHLNTRDNSDPMKGHPGYQGDDLDFVASIIRKVGSPRIKLLFDIYHVQLMHGDLIRRIEQNKDIIGHVHTAGAPGRGELDDNQEVNYAAVIKKLLDGGYTGYIGQEFIPTRDPLAGLKQAVKVCDV